MTVPLKERYFEDYAVGEVFVYGDHAITEEEVVGFARRYDPQPFHVDPEAARDSIYGGLIASGWMTGAVMMRMLVDHFISPLSGMGSPGIDELRWHKPVRPGDRLRVRLTLLDKRRSATRPDRGLIQVQQEALNQDGEVVMTIRSWGLYRCRDAAA
ncbi:MAG TPA: MaoC family dehydratase [Quisquiliibacterium sp.]|mgnify:FL=1|nr:MaoC family dehydratase [Quisquiliibacterium sp.]